MAHSECAINWVVRLQEDVALASLESRQGDVQGDTESVSFEKAHGRAGYRHPVANLRQSTSALHWSPVCAR